MRSQWWDGQLVRYPTYTHESTMTDETVVMEKVGDTDAETQIIEKIIAPLTAPLTEVDGRLAKLSDRVKALEKQLEADASAQQSAATSAQWALFAMVVSVLCGLFGFAVLISVAFLGG